MIKYEKEIMNLLSELLRTDDMSDTEFDELVSETIKESGIDIQKMSDDIEIGISNGYSLDTQFQLFKMYFKNLKVK